MISSFVRPGPVVIETQGTLRCSPETAWAFITDWERQSDWMLEASDFVVTSDIREGVGVEAEATIRIAGLATRDRVKVSGWEPPRTLVIEHLGWVGGRGEISLRSLDGDSTHLFWRETLHPPLGLLGGIGMRSLKPLLARTFARDFRVLQALCRAASAADWSSGRK